MSSETNMSYLAGVIDCDGSIFMAKNYSCEIRISNTRVGLLRKIQQIIKEEFGIIKRIEESKNNPRGKLWRKGYLIRITKRKYVKQILLELIKFLTIKSSQAYLILLFIDKTIGKKHCYEELKELNRKGIK